MLGEVPISVTHCDISGCTRVFTSSTPGQPLKLSVGGLRGYRMILKFAERLYLQETSELLDEEGPSLPYREFSASVTTWEDWRQAHPKTDVYIGAAGKPLHAEKNGIQ